MPISGKQICWAILALMLQVVAISADAQNTFSAAYKANSSAIDVIPARFGLRPHLENLVISPTRLAGGSALTIISPERWESLGQRVAHIVEELHGEYSAVFGKIPPFVATVRLMDREAFLIKTGAPAWTNAIYYRGEIMIPLSDSEKLDTLELVRAVRHEYLHAVVHSLSSGRCAGWLDEGLAQWVEGDENPALTMALSRWISSHPPVALSALQGGFTKLESQMVPAAYAQSLFSANQIVQTYGFKPIRLYFDALKADKPAKEAFRSSFGVSEEAFETSLVVSLAEWQRRRMENVVALNGELH